VDVWILRPTEDNERAGDIAVAVISWWKTPSDEDAEALAEGFSGDWTWSDEVMADMDKALPAETGDLWVEWDTVPGEQTATYVEVWMAPGGDLSEDEQQNETSRLTRFAIDNVP
jgi:hypothetical protein